MKMRLFFHWSVYNHVVTMNKRILEKAVSPEKQSFQFVMEILNLGAKIRAFFQTS